MKLIHTWTYLDTSGEVLGLVKRFEIEDEHGQIKKNVVPYFVRDGSRWAKGGAQKPRPLYNLPSLFGAKAIAVVEGEKCADALQQFGFPATTSCGGAHGVKETDWSPAALAQRVYLLPDADAPGEVYIEQVAKQIATFNPDTKFFVLRIPSLVDGQDIVDWVQGQVPGWDGYSKLDDENRTRIQPTLEGLLKVAAPYFPDVHDSPTAPPKRQSSDSHVAEVRAALTFQGILSHFGKSTSGTDRGNGCTRITSPFAPDSNPSFDFNESEKWFHCFSSGNSGDVFNLIALLEGCGTKGSEWKRVMEVAESITGIVKPKQEKKSNVTSISTRLPLNVPSIAHDLLSISNDGVSAEDALTLCEPVLRAMAASDGVQDEFIFGHIKDHFHLKANFLKPFRARMKAFRDELKTAGRIESPRGGDGEKPVDAPRELYLSLFPQFLGTIRRDIFSGDSLYWDEQEKVYAPVLNQMKYLKSQFLAYGERHNVRFFMSAVDYHFEEFSSKLEPRLVIDIPEWDGVDYLKQLVERVTLSEIEIPGLGKIDNAVMEEFIKEWHAKMWEKLANPHVQNRIIVLKGDQGIGKDYWQAEQLGGLGQFMVPMTVEDSNKDTKAQLHQGLAVTISEFDRTVKQHTSTMKELLTAATTMIRLPYDARAKPRYVRCSFMASCNVDEVLRDHTGNRRYVLFALTDIDRTTQFTDAQKLQVLAQGKVLAREKYRVSEPFEKLMAAYIAQETPDSPTSLLLEEWDDMAHAHYETRLTEEQKIDACRQITRSDAPKEAFGFMPNKWMADDRVLEKLGKKFGWNERYVVALMKKAGRRGRCWMTAGTERGFFWHQKDAPPLTPLTLDPTDDDIDFL